MTAFFFVVLLLFSGCRHTESGPPSTHTNSSQFTTLQEKIDFLQTYVSFRRNYETLDFNIFYQNNGNGSIPGPSDWDIALVATIPASEVHLWIDSTDQKSDITEPPAWVDFVPTSLDISGIDEWYGSSLGIDRERNIIAWRHSTMQ